MEDKREEKEGILYMHKLIAPRFALPTIVVLALVTLAIIAIVLLTTHHGLGTAYMWLTN